MYRPGMKKPTDAVRDHKFKVGQTVYYTTGVGIGRRVTRSRSCSGCRRRAVITSIASRAPASHLIEL